MIKSNLLDPKNQVFFADQRHLDALRVKKDDPESLKAVAKEFEAIFIQMALKSMRDAAKAFKSNIFDSNAMDYYQEMHDQQLSLNLASSGRVGLSNVIVKQLSHGSPESKEQTAAELTKPVDVKQKFIEKIMPHATSAAKKIGVDPKVLIAQAALETGWGEKMQNNNLFNIKAHKNDQQAWLETTEYENNQPKKVKSGFKVYNNIVESISDYVKLITGSNRYKQVLDKLPKIDDAKNYMDNIHKAGYATDPKYVSKVMKIYEKIKKMTTT